MRPLVSIIIPVYNGSNYLKQAIDSALAQTYNNVEVIVINDGSNDNGATEAIAKSYGNKIRYYTKPNGGVSTALNLGIKKMKGQYFSWLSHDDLYHPQKIEKQMEVMEKNYSNVIVASDVTMLYENGLSRRIRINSSDFDYFEIFLATASIIGLNGCSLIIPKKAFRGLQFDSSKRYTQDYDMWLRISQKYRFILISESLVISRQHNQQDSVEKRSSFVKEADQLHRGMVESLSHDQMQRYLTRYRRFRRLQRNLRQFIENGYLQTAQALVGLVMDVMYRVNDWRFVIFASDYFQQECSNPWQYKKCYEQLIHKQELDDLMKQILQNKFNNCKIQKDTLFRKITNSIKSDGNIFTLKRILRKILGI